MNFNKFVNATIFSFAVICFFGFFIIFAQIFSGNLEDFFMWKEVSSKNFLSDIEASIAGDGLFKTFLPYRNWQVEDLKINAKSGLIVQITKDKKEKILFENKADAKYPVASLSKLVTALVVIDNVKEDEKITINKKRIPMPQDSELKDGDTYFAKDLLKVMLVESNNVASFAFEDFIGKDKFKKLMADKTKEIGLEFSYFENAAGVGAINYSTAKDLLLLVNFVKNNKPEIFQITTIPDFDLYDANLKFKYKVPNTNKLLQDTDILKTIIGGKTGFNSDSGECLILLTNSPDGNGYIVSIIIGSDDRFTEMKNMINWQNKAYIWK